ncbi:MAG TPA: DUF2079 domain-containing protein [Candidatus Cybelea sp.]|nr:DUF2079 domain-containing protein [Candidatus Cybelea sp.]
MKLTAIAIWNAAVAATFLALATVLCLIVQWRYAIFRNGVDLGIFSQVLAGLGSGFSSTVEGGVNHLLVHWSPVIVAAWPFLRAFGPVGLEYVQAVLVAATLFPIWGLARARFGAPAAFAFVAVAALYPILWANGVGDFHEMAFVPLLSATLVYALDRRRWTLAVVAALLLLCTKEDQFVVLTAVGLLFAATAGGDVKAKRAGWTIAGLAIGMAAAYFAVVRPALNPHVAYMSLGFFDWSGTQATGQSFVWNALLERIRYVAIVLAPLAFLPCISRYGLFLIPGFVEILASRQPVTLMPGAHYSALLTGYALAAFVDGTSRLATRPRLVMGLVAAAAAISIGVGIFASPMEYWYYLYRRPNAHDELLEATLRQLPPRADVGAEDEIFAHLGLDPEASIDFNGQRWFVYDRSHYSERWHEIDEPAVAQALAERSYVVESDRDGIVVLCRAVHRGGLPPGGCGGGSPGGRFGNGAGL